MVTTIQDSTYSRSVFRVCVENVTAPSLFLRKYFTIYQTMWCHTVTLRPYKEYSSVWKTSSLVEPIFILPKERTFFCESRRFTAVVSKATTAFVIRQFYFKSTTSVIHFNGNLPLLPNYCKLVLHLTFY